MSMDGITAGLLLAASTNGAGNDEVYNLYKSLQGNNEAPAPEIVEMVKGWIGKPCKVRYTDHVGIVHGANESTSGFYPGGRFPVYVKITESGCEEAVGKVFEYSLEQVELTN